MILILFFSDINSLITQRSGAGEGVAADIVHDLDKVCEQLTRVTIDSYRSNSNNSSDF